MSAEPTYEPPVEPADELTNEAGESLADLFRAYRETDTGIQADDGPEPLRLEDIFTDLGGVAEIAAMLGVGKSRVNRWVERREAVKCPVPVRSLGCGHIYLLSDWLNWYRLWKVTRGSETWWTNRQPGDPKPAPHRGSHRRRREEG